MTVRVGINGYGRIGRSVLRAHYESEKRRDLAIVAVNDTAPLGARAHLTRYDSTHGKFCNAVEERGHVLGIDGDWIMQFSQPDASLIPWGALGIEVVLECTGRLASRQRAAAHLRAGAKRVVVSAPAEGVDATIVYGVNQQTLRPSDTIVSNASCTANCLAVLLQPLDRDIGIENGFVTTVHGYTSDQLLTDGFHQDPRRGRGATSSILPVATQATRVLERVLPGLAGKLEGQSLRVPTTNVAMVEVSFLAARNTTTGEVNDIMRLEAARSALTGIFSYNDAPLVSVDFNHDPASATFDATLTQVAGRLVKVSAWYDNEWAYANRLLDTTMALAAAARFDRRPSMRATSDSDLVNATGSAPTRLRKAA